VETLRQRQVRNFAVLLLCPRAFRWSWRANEVGRSQHGNNNAWNQANELSWLDWQRTPQAQELRRFWRLLIGFRKRHPTSGAGRSSTAHGNERGVLDIEWHGCLLGAPGWLDPTTRVLAFTLAGFDGRRRPARHPQHGRAGARLRASRRRGTPLAPGPSTPPSRRPTTRASLAGSPSLPEQGLYRAAARSAVVLVSAAG